jgi:DNA-binding transcriptional regulator GbsR (MarR family)
MVSAMDIINGAKSPSGETTSSPAMQLIQQRYQQNNIPMPSSPPTPTAPSSPLSQPPKLNPLQQLLSGAENVVKTIGNAIKLTFTAPTIHSPIPQEQPVQQIQSLKLQPTQKVLTPDQLDQISPTSGASAQLTTKASMTPISKVIGNISTVLQKQFPQTSDLISSLVNDPLSMKANPKKIVNDVISAFQKPLATAVQRTVASQQPSKSVADSISKELLKISGTASFALSPIGALFSAANDIPVLSSLSKLLMLPYVTVGEGAPKISNSIIDSLPLSSKTKTTLKPAVAEVFTLASQVALGHFMDATAGEYIRNTGADILQRLTKDIITEYKLPETVSLTGKQLQDIHQTGNLTTPEEKAWLADLKKNGQLTDQQYSDLIKSGKGITVNIPAEKIVTMVDKPYWAKVKEFFGKTATEPVSSVQSYGQKTTGANIAGLLPEGEHTPQEVINTIMQNKLETTSEGKQLIQAAVQAQGQGKNINVEKVQPPVEGGVPPIPKLVNDPLYEEMFNTIRTEQAKGNKELAPLKQVLSELENGKITSQQQLDARLKQLNLIPPVEGGVSKDTYYHASRQGEIKDFKSIGKPTYLSQDENFGKNYLGKESVNTKVNADLGKSITLDDKALTKILSKSYFADQARYPTVQSVVDDFNMSDGDIRDYVFRKLKEQGYNSAVLPNDWNGGFGQVKSTVVFDPAKQLKTIPSGVSVPQITAPSVVEGGVSKGLESLANEARKYKSAENIAKRQGFNTVEDYRKWFLTNKQSFPEKLIDGQIKENIQAIKNLDEHILELKSENGKLSKIQPLQGKNQFVDNTKMINKIEKSRNEYLEMLSNSLLNKDFYHFPNIKKMVSTPKVSSVVEGGVKGEGKPAPPVSPTVKQVSGGEAVKPVIEPQKVSPAKTVSVPKEQLPVGEGVAKASKLEARMKGVIGQATPEQIDALGLSTYKVMNKAEQKAQAAKYVVNNQQEALDVLKGKVNPPKGLIPESIYMALTELSKDDPTLATKIASLQATALGQRISILSEINKDNPVRLLNEVYKVREAVFQKKFGGKTVKQVTDNVVKNIKAKVKVPDKYDWGNFIKSLKTC